MDRREAMRKLAIGGGTVIGVSAVVSQPAFAYSGPTATTDATLAAVRGNDRRVDLTVTGLGTTACSGSSIGSNRVFLDATATTLSLSGGGAYLQMSPFGGVGGPALPETTTSTTFSVRRVGTPNAFAGGDSFTVAIRVTHTCTYTGTGTGSTVRTTTRTVTWIDPPAPGAPVVT